MITSIRSWLTLWLKVILLNWGRAIRALPLLPAKIAGDLDSKTATPAVAVFYFAQTVGPFTARIAGDTQASLRSQSPSRANRLSDRARQSRRDKSHQDPVEDNQNTPSRQRPD